MPKNIKEEVPVILDNVPYITRNGEIVYLRRSIDTKGRVKQDVVTKEGRKVDPYSAAITLQAGASKYGAKKQYDLGRRVLRYKQRTFGYDVFKEIVPVVGWILLFLVLMGFGLAGLNIIFTGNNIFYFAGIILILLFFVKKRSNKV